MCVIMYDHMHIMKLIAAEGFLEHHKPLGLTREALLKGTWYYRISVTLPEVKWWTFPFDELFLSRHFLLFLFSLPLNPDSYLRAAYANGADNWVRTCYWWVPITLLSPLRSLQCCRTLARNASGYSRDWGALETPPGEFSMKAVSWVGMQISSITSYSM